MAKSTSKVKKNTDGTVTITTTTTQTICPESLPKALVDGMIDEATNPMSWVDGYTYNAWRSQYGEKMIDAVRELVIKPMQRESEWVVDKSYRNTPEYRDIDRNKAITLIKAAFKARGLRYSVTGGRGTAWGWITIDLLPAVYKSLDEAGRKTAYLKLGADLGKEKGYTSESIPASSDYYREYVDRANGDTPSVIGRPYWD